MQILKHSAKNHSSSCFGSCSNPPLVLLRLLLKNANSCRSLLQYSGSCTPLVWICPFALKARLQELKFEFCQIKLG